MAGATAGAFVRRAGSEAFLPFTTAFGVRSPSKFADVRLAEGDLVMLESAGGAGYGPPRAREPALVEADVREGLVSAEAAARVYGKG
jgi:N-methylhydantoinase B/oxoprolinase/acetone carboxylase alpha subunit